MKVFLDTNILLDFVTEREGVEEACDILQLGEDGKINLSTSYLSMANTAYVAISRNKKHFSFSHIPVYSPVEFLIQITVLPDSAG